MNKEKAMCKVNERISELFSQLVYQDKIPKDHDYMIVNVFKHCAIDVLFDEYSHGKTSPEREQKWDCVRSDINRVIASDGTDFEWRDKVLLLEKSDVVQKIINEQLCVQKWQYRDEFIQKVLELFKDIKSDIGALITLYVFRGNTVDRDVFFK